MYECKNGREENRRRAFVLHIPVADSPHVESGKRIGQDRPKGYYWNMAAEQRPEKKTDLFLSELDRNLLTAYIV